MPAAFRGFAEAKFPFGAVRTTPKADEVLGRFEMLRGLYWHSQGYWGDVDQTDQEANDRALVDGTRLLSAYIADNGIRFWIITEADRSSTTVLLPDEY